MLRFLHSRSCVLVASLLMAIGACLFFNIDALVYPTGEMGVVKGWSGQWLFFPEVNLFYGIAANVGLAFLMVSVIGRYNLLRSMTKLPATLFLMMQLATPVMLTFFSTGLLLCAGVMACMLLMYESYNDSKATRHVFLTFFLLSLGSTVDYGFLVYIPVFWLALAQMRILDLRSILAMLMGLVTPWILLFGFGIIDVSQLQWPMYSRLTVPFVTLRGTTFIGAALLTAFIAAAAWVQNIIKFLSYNAHSRALLSLLTVLMYVSILASVVDYSHLVAFLPIINMCAAMQLGHLFGVVYTMKRSYIAILCIIGLYLLIYIWRLVICAL